MGPRIRAARRCGEREGDSRYGADCQRMRSYALDVAVARCGIFRAWSTPDSYISYSQTIQTIVYIDYRVLHAVSATRLTNKPSGRDIPRLRCPVSLLSIYILTSRTRNSEFERARGVATKSGPRGVSRRVTTPSVSYPAPSPRVRGRNQQSCWRGRTNRLYHKIDLDSLQLDRI